MSLSLEFYSASGSDLAKAIGSRSRSLFGMILRKTEPYFDEIFEPEDFDDGPDFERGLERWIDGDVAPAGVASPIDNLGDALGFVGLIRYYGDRMGAMSHTPLSGERFRRDFLLGAAQGLIKPPYSLERLIARPLLGYESADIPFWGGLSRAELAELAPALRNDAPIWPDDIDIDGWLPELWSALTNAVDSGRDLITVYS